MHRRIQRGLEEPWRFSDGFTDSAQRGRKPYMYVGNVTVAKEVIGDDRRKLVSQREECTGIIFLHTEAFSIKTFPQN